MEKWSIHGWNVEFMEEFNCLDITLENTGDCNNQKAQ